MSEPKFEVPAELRNMAERTVEQAEKAFDMFFSNCKQVDGATFSFGSGRNQKALLIAEQNMRSAFDHARKLAQAPDFQEVMQIQSEFLKGQMAKAGEQIREIADGMASAGKNMTQGKSKACGST